MTKKTQESVEKFAFGYHSALNNLFINSNHTILVSIGNLKSLYDGVNQLSLFDLSAFTIQQNSIEYTEYAGAQVRDETSQSLCCYTHGTAPIRNLYFLKGF